MLPTASALDRAMACTASATLPRVVKTTPATEHGHGFHGCVERARQRAEALVTDAVDYEQALELARAEVLEGVPRDATYRELFEGFPLATIPRGAQSELTLAWDWQSGTTRVLGASLDRDYSAAAPTEFVGTADLVGRIDDTVLVDDFKTGRKYVAAQASWQLKMLSVAAAAHVGAHQAVARMLYVRDGEGVIIETARFDFVALARARVELAALGRRIAEATAPRPHVGPWCDYCASMIHCPAFTQLARESGALALELDGKAWPALGADWTAADAGQAYSRIAATELVLRRAREGLEEIAKQSPLPLPDGRVVREVETEREYLEAEKTLRLLDAKFPNSEFVAKAVTLDPKTSKAQIERALVAAGKKKKDALPIFDELRAAGAVVVKKFRNVKPTDDKESAA